MSFKEAMQNVMGKSKKKIDPKAAAAIVANASRNASPAAKKANPKLNKVAGKGKPVSAGKGKSVSVGKGKAVPIDAVKAKSKGGRR